MSTGKPLLKDWEQLAADAEFRPARVAASCGMSLRQLQRVCEKQFEKTPTELIRELRCRMALDLVSKGYSNKEVAAMLKFASPTHFCHDFRKAYARSPRKEATALVDGRGDASEQRLSLSSNRFSLTAPPSRLIVRA